MKLRISITINNIYLEFWPFALIGYRDHWQKYHLIITNGHFSQLDFGPFCIVNEAKCNGR